MKKRILAVAIAALSLALAISATVTVALSRANDDEVIAPTDAPAVNKLAGEFADDDMGMVIGRHGRIAKAIRTVIKAAAAPTGKKVNVEIC